MAGRGEGTGALIEPRNHHEQASWPCRHDHPSITVVRPMVGETDQASHTEIRTLPPAPRHRVVPAPRQRSGAWQPVRYELTRCMIRGQAKPQAIPRLAFCPGQGSLALWSAPHPPRPLAFRHVTIFPPTRATLGADTTRVPAAS